MKYIFTFGIAFLIGINVASGQCDLQVEADFIFCDANGTTCDPFDNLIYVFLNITGSQNGWTTSDPGWPEEGGANGLHEFGPYAVSEGMISIIITDPNVPDCEVQVEVIDPTVVCDPEISFELQPVVNGVTIDDNGTPGVCSDDTYTASVSVSALGFGYSSGWRFQLGNGNFVPGALYGEVVILGPYPLYEASGQLNNQHFNINDNTVSGCGAEIFINPEAPINCECEVDFNYNLSSYVQDNGTPEDCSDNFSRLTFSDNSLGITGGYEMLLDNEQVFVGVFGDGGGIIQIPADSVAHSLTMRSLEDNACFATYALPIVYTNCPFDPVTFFFNDTNACGTENVCVAVQASNFTNILGMQTSVNYDPELLTFTGSTNFNPVMVGFTPGSIGNPSPGNITLTWNDPFAVGVSIPEEEALLELCFTPVVATSYLTSLSYSNSPTPTEVVSNGGVQELIPVILNAGSVSCPCELTFSQELLPFDDNGTPTQCSDDEFSFSLVVENTDAVGAIWQALDEYGTVVFSGTYGVEALAGPFPLYDEALVRNTIQWTIQDAMEPLCSYTYTYSPPEPADCDCEMYVDIAPDSLPNWIDCSLAGSSFDFSVTVNKIPSDGEPQVYQLYEDGEVIASSLSYGSNTRSLNINAKPVVLRFEDMSDPSCFTEVDFQSLAQDCQTDLSLQVSETPNTQAQPGETFDLHLRLANNNLRTATDITVAAPVPAGYTYLGSNGNYNPGTGEWQVAQLICEEDTTLTLSLRLEASGDSLFLAEVVAVNEEDSDSTPANGIDTDADGHLADDPDDEDDGDAWLPCPVQVGTFTLLADTLCAGEPLDWTWNSDADLPVGYIRGVALYADVNALPSDYLAFTTSNTLTPPEGVEPNRPYYLRLLAGPDDGDGEIDLMGNCLRRGVVNTVLWSEIFIENCQPVVINCANPIAILSCPASGGIASLSYTWSQNGEIFATTTQAFAPGIGNILLEVRDEIGCVASQEIIVVGDFSPPVLSLSRSGSLCDEEGVLITVTSDIEGTGYTWSTGESGSQISVFSGGTYTAMAVNPENGCSGESTIIINDILEECNILQGTAYRSEDCIASETPLVGWLVEVAGDNYLQYQYTNSQGNYEIAVPQGSYQVRLIANSPTWGVCEEEGQAVVFSGYGETLDQVLLAQPLDNCPLLEVSIDVGILRPCFADRTLTLAYGNVGTDTLFDGLLAVVLPSKLTFSSTTGAYQGSVGDTLFFTPMLPLAPGSSRQFTVFVNVACDAVVGSSLCVQALGLPYGPCPQASANWLGGSLQLSGECDTEEVVFTLRNVGDASLSPGGSYIVIQDGVMLWEVPEDIPPLGPDEATTVSFPANGNTFLLEAQQEPFHPGFSNPAVVLEGCGTNEDGVFSMGYVTQFANDEEDVFVDEDCRIVTASYDPNDKQAEPVGYATEHYVVPERSLEYTIRFQNTGTDTAFTVVIRDTLSQWLDMRTLRPGVSSHPYELELDTARALSFVFNDILLPDSTTNLDGSQGFVSYQVKPLLTAPLETRIENTAAIYFDFNDPIITNTVYHTLGRNFVDLINWTTVPSAASTWRLFPNPNEGHLNVEWLPVTERAILIVTDAWGRQQAQFTLTGGKMELDVRFLPPGWYGLQLIGAQGSLLGTGKLIRQ